MAAAASPRRVQSVRVRQKKSAFGPLESRRGRRCEVAVEAMWVTAAVGRGRALTNGGNLGAATGP
jgi:hypothetical protein